MGNHHQECMYCGKELGWTETGCGWPNIAAKCANFAKQQAGVFAKDALALVPKPALPSDPAPAPGPTVAA